MQGAKIRKALKKYLPQNPTTFNSYKGLLRESFIQSAMASMVIASLFSIIPGLIDTPTLFATFLVFSVFFVACTFLLYVFIFKAEVDYVFFWHAVEQGIIPRKIGVLFAKNIRPRAIWSPSNLLLAIFVKLNI